MKTGKLQMNQNDEPSTGILVCNS